MNQAIGLVLAALFLMPAASPSATKDQSPPDKEMLKMMEFLRDMEMIKQLDMMQELHNVDGGADQAKNGTPQKSVPERKKESAK